VYWISIASTEGKPHAAPVWEIWKNNRFFFETDPKSPKGRNLIRNPRIVFHVQEGMDTVIVEGIAEREENLGTLRVLKTDYVRKYDYKPDWSDKERQIVFRVKPRIAHAWKAPRMHRNLVNFVF
jgi:nitroimidazol reductase NimA-like FMN-containing flavoprotein (pyridoxamine 5'-phosphate oxidase superfamily)